MNDSAHTGDTKAAPHRNPSSAARLLDLGEELTPTLEPVATPEELQQSFPQYEIIELIGHGGMGAVYKARQKTLDRVVAIKLLPFELGKETGFATRFEREARAMAKLSHPNIVTVFDYGRTDAGRLYFVMEFVDGTTLSDLIRSNTMDGAQSLSIAAQLCDALAYAHAEGVVHRDVKPANVLVDQRNRVKVADFGLVRLTNSDEESSSLTMTGTVMGTLDYMAPEQRVGMEVDHRADIYSLGVIIYEMFCRERPQGAFTPPSKRSGCDSRIDEIVNRALQQEPGRRYGTTQEMKAAVETVRASDARAARIQRIRSRILWTVSALASGALVAYFAIASHRQPQRVAKAESSSTRTSADARADAERCLSSLAALNSGFDQSTASWKSEDGEVVELSLDIVSVRDLSPVSALKKLRRLRLGRTNQTGQLATLAALRGLPLDWLECHNTPISDLTPLSGMPLKWFVCQGSDVRDLTPIHDCPLQALGINGTPVESLEAIRGLPLKFLNCGRTDVSDLTPLTGMPITDLNISRTHVTNLEPLRGMALNRLICNEAQIADFSPIREMPLKELTLDFNPSRDSETLRAIRSLEKINGVRVSEFWRSQ